MVRLESWRFSRHRGRWAWVVFVFVAALLFAIAMARHAGFSGPWRP
jgi:hypothetical protein